MQSALRWARRAVVLLVVLAATTGGLAWHQGYRLYVVHTGSMAPALRPGDAVLDAPAPTSVHPGEVVTFTVHSGPDSVVTHRVASYSDGIVHTKGDANRTADPWTLHLSQVVGTVAAFLPRGGYVLVYLKQPQGLGSILTVTLGLALLWQVFFPSGSSGTPLTAGGETPRGEPEPAHRRGLNRQARHPRRFGASTRPAGRRVAVRRSAAR